jgi:hypothetical protein
LEKHTAYICKAEESAEDGKEWYRYRERDGQDSSSERTRWSKEDGENKKVHRFFSVSFTPVDLLMDPSQVVPYPAFVSLSTSLSSLFFPADGGSKFFQNISKLREITVSHPGRQYFPVLHV